MSLAPGLGCYRVSESLPGTAITSVDCIRNRTVTLGVEHRFGDGWRLYAGRAIEAGSVAVTVANLAVGHPLRQCFLANCLQTDEDRYGAYWTVRRHVGKGAPPRELASVAEMLDFVARTLGALGYIDAAAAAPGLNSVCRV